MTPGRQSAAGRFVRLLGLLVGAVAVLALLGYVPTRELGGEGAVGAMLAACAVSLVASIAGALPIALAEAGGGAGARETLLSMGARFAVAVVLALGLALSGRVERAPFLLWVGISYVALLIVDLRYVVTAGRPAPDHGREKAAPESRTSDSRTTES